MDIHSVLITVLLVIFLSIITLSFIHKKSKFIFDENENSIAEITHDLKTPTAAQLRACELLLNGMFGKISKEQEEIITTMTNSNKYMLDLINNILLYSKFKNNEINMKFEIFDFNELVTTIVKSLYLTAKEKNCEINLFLNKDEIYINAHKIGIQRVITNLISNAIKFAKNSSKITVELISNLNECEFSVTNRGKDINNSDEKNIFKKYNSYENNGTGLGLYISELIISKHNEKIKIEKDKNGNNRFYFKLPKAKCHILSNK